MANIVKFMCAPGHPVSWGTGAYMGSGVRQVKRERLAAVTGVALLQAPIADRPTTVLSAETCELRT